MIRFGKYFDLVRRWVQDTSGNVAMTFGLAFIPVVMTVGVAVDYTNASAVEGKLAGTADAIALAAARTYKDLERRDTIGDHYLETNLDDYNLDVNVTNLDVDFDDDAKLVTVVLTANIPTHIMKIAGYNYQTVSIRSVVSYDGHVSEPVSLGLVLDVSGSMNWYGKIATLRTAATGLLDKLDNADPEAVYVRSGLVTYYSQIRHSVSMDWGIGHTRSVVQGLWASGGTRSTAAVERAGDWLMSPTELAEHTAQPQHEGEEFVLHKFMIFMTDGDNNYNSDDEATEDLCDEIKAEGVEIFSVAFEAPAGGRALLEYCASSEEHYYDAGDSEEFQAAFEEIGDRIEEALLRIVE